MQGTNRCNEFRVMFQIFNDASTDAFVNNPPRICLIHSLHQTSSLMSMNPSLHPTRHGNMSRPSTSLSFHTSRTNARSTSPVKGSVTKLYDLPPALDAPAAANPSRRARPGGLAARASDTDARSVFSERTGGPSRRGSELTKSRLDVAAPTSPISDSSPSQDVRVRQNRNDSDDRNCSCSRITVEHSISRLHLLLSLWATYRQPSPPSHQRIEPSIQSCRRH